MYCAAIARLRSGGGYCSEGVYAEAERLCAECQFPLCGRTEVGSIQIARRACCMGLSLSGRSSLWTRTTMVMYRSPELQAVTRYLCEIIKQSYPKLHFSSLQINVNARARMHQDTGNVGYSVVAAIGRFAGGQLFTVAQDGQPILQDVCGRFSIIDGRAPHCVLPFAGYRLSVVGFLHTQCFRNMEALGV